MHPCWRHHASLSSEVKTLHDAALVRARGSSPVSHRMRDHYTIVHWVTSQTRERSSSAAGGLLAAHVRSRFVHEDSPCIYELRVIILVLVSGLKCFKDVT